MYRGGGVKKRKEMGNIEGGGKKFQSALFCPLGWRTGNNFLFKGGLTKILQKGLDNDRILISSVP